MLYNFEVSQSDDSTKELKSEENAASEGPDSQGVGTVEKKEEENMEQGAHGSGATKVAPIKENEVQEIKKRQRPGESDDQRALGEFLFLFSFIYYNLLTMIIKLF